MMEASYLQSFQECEAQNCSFEIIQLRWFCEYAYRYMVMQVARKVLSAFQHQHTMCLPTRKKIFPHWIVGRLITH